MPRNCKGLGQASRLRPPWKRKRHSAGEVGPACSSVEVQLTTWLKSRLAFPSDIWGWGVFVRMEGSVSFELIESISYFSMLRQNRKREIWNLFVFAPQAIRMPGQMRPAIRLHWSLRMLLLSCILSWQWFSSFLFLIVKLKRFASRWWGFGDWQFWVFNLWGC